MYNIKNLVFYHLNTYNVRRFSVWRQLSPVCDLSTEVSAVLNHASELAKRSGSGSIESEFIVKSLLDSCSSYRKWLRTIRLSPGPIATELDDFIKRRRYTNGEERVGRSSQSAILYAQSLALSRSKPVGILELSEALLKYDDFLRGIHQRSDAGKPKVDQNAVEECLYNLTEAAKNGSGNVFVGRENELERLKGSLNRMRKNNVLLIGEPGVGKTALVERLAVDMLLEDPNITVYSLDLCRLYSGQGTRGELEAKLKSIFDTVKNGKSILFIDEIHHLIQNQENGVNVTNLLKPIMTSTLVKIIGSTTAKEYHQYFRRDRAFERRFEILRLHENSADETLAILHGSRPSLEDYHGVKITDDALVASVELSTRFIPNRYLPDKAIDLLDEAAMLSKRKRSCSNDLFELLRHKTGIISALLRGKSGNDQLNRVLSEIESMESRYKSLHGKLRDVQQQQQNHEKNGNLTKASELKNHKIPEIIRLIVQLQSDIKMVINKTIEDSKDMLPVDMLNDGNTGVSPASDPDVFSGVYVDRIDIASALSQSTGIPVSVVLRSQMGHYEQAVQQLSNIVLGQNEAVYKTLLHIYMYSSSIASGRKIGAALYYVGPPGVGKRLLLNHVSRMFGMALKYICGSNLVSSNATNILVGSPPGYIGHREGGMLCEWIKDHPYGIVAFEDAHLLHVNVVNLLIGAIDNGFLVDNQGDQCNLRQCFFVFVSNDHEQLSPLIKQNADDVISFEPLSKESVERIICKELASIDVVKLRASKAALEHLYHLAIGTKSIPNLIYRTLGSSIANLVVSGRVPIGASGELIMKSEVNLHCNHSIHICDDMVLVRDV
ncbi:putative chaperone clpB [Babesia bovis T2Bo]|uniref:Chaperone clpB, putative n=1 Tax=Babesia bovis TaxID=5865 RepID=A7AW26_BABBO|nr:putative chaperone clpB [Babesia bovis T2Bo]EDO05254.1 putative chaperone clpB [Babesia bovis T2Bo]|eukprot:XP_001608822.1 chaperone clpB [Babesia bovis T2Bo]